MNMGRTKKRSTGDVAARLIFLVYCGIMLWLLFGQRMGDELSAGSVNLVPLQTLKLYRKLLHNNSPYLAHHAFINLAGNVLLFIPLGWFLPRIWGRLRGFFRVLLLVLLIVVLVETLQYFTGLGSCDIDDLILNVPGAMLGYAVWACFGRRA